MRLTLPEGETVNAFSSAIQRLTGGSEGKVLLSVSGGPDSLAMLLLAKSAIADSIFAATVDHGLRTEAAAEARIVAQLCVELDVPHVTLHPEEPIAGNVQAGAREVRYALLGAHAKVVGCQWIATAHHADDQLETLLMRLARGSGVTGLSAIRERQGKVIRPLLNYRKAALEDICAKAGVEPVRDPSNDNAEFDRVAVRQWLAQTTHPLDPLRAARSAAALADASQALDWMTNRLETCHLQRDGSVLRLDPEDLPAELQRRLLLKALDTIEPGIAPRGDAMDRALTDLADGKRFTLGNVLCEGGKTWHFSPAPPRNT